MGASLGALGYLRLSPCLPLDTSPIPTCLNTTLMLTRLTVFPASSLPGTLAGVFLPSFLSNMSRSDPDCPLQIQPSSERPEAGRLGSGHPSFLRHDLPIEAGKCHDVFVPVVRRPRAASGFLKAPATPAAQTGSGIQPHRPAMAPRKPTRPVHSHDHHLAQAPAAAASPWTPHEAPAVPAS